MALGVIILTGGGSSRMGADKALLDWNGRRAVDRLADLARDVGAVLAVSSGPVSYGFPTAVEDPPGGGPVAGLLAAAALLRPACDRALVLAVDAPTITVADLAPLLAVLSPGACFDGLPLPLVVDLSALPSEDGAGWAMQRLVDMAGLRRLPCPAEAEAEARLRGANAPAERAALLEALMAAEDAQKRGAG
jgi:molybdenum cofactor guanylyltransferase